MRRLSLKKANRGFVWAALLAMAALFFILTISPAAGQYNSSDMSASANKSAALQLIEGANASQTPKQPPGLVGKPQSHTAPPETAPPRPVPEPVQPPAGELPVSPPVIKPKVPYCPQYNSGSGGSDEMYPCDPCVRPLTPDGTGPCIVP